MGGYVLRRLMMLLPVLFAVSVVSFIIIELPPGDVVSRIEAQRASQGFEMTEAERAALIQQYGLDQNIWARYLNWMGDFLRGDLGRSFQWDRPVADLLAERIPLTIVISLATVAFIFAVAVPIGVYSAVHKNSLFDYLFTFLGFIGLATPNFLVALILLWLFHWLFGVNMSGSFSEEFVDAPWSLDKVLDLLSRIWFPVLIIGTAGTASVIRVMRGNLLDELEKQYVITARAKGMRESAVLVRYPLRIAINPIVSTIGWLLPSIVGGEVLVSIVLNLQTTGPLLLGSVINQDVYLAASIILILSVLTVVGTLVADLLLAWLDPRIRFERVSR
ncbi:ABC transporter permease [Phytoactinopolyspora endophytica]|uniref:ABC transporter permease n=1 Tax=Phytoactinopolyspora endophytica TaxID=1642495 RepID=UPI00101CFEF6|nr:ABC transporter permease [Phytoactinopolyspora endophytica]